MPPRRSKPLELGTAQGRWSWLSELVRRKRRVQVRPSAGAMCVAIGVAHPRRTPKPPGCPGSTGSSGEHSAFHVRSHDFVNRIDERRGARALVPTVPAFRLTVPSNRDHQGLAELLRLRHARRIVARGTPRPQARDRRPRSPGALSRTTHTDYEKRRTTVFSQAVRRAQRPSVRVPHDVQQDHWPGPGFAPC